MAFSIKNESADELLRELTSITGESLTEAVIVSLRERLAREQRRAGASRNDSLDAAVARFRSLARTDATTDDDAIGYDEHGLPE
jgi:antitoxin VapB